MVKNEGKLSNVPGEKFFLEDPCALFRTLALVPPCHANIGARLNALTRLVLLVSLILFVVNNKYAYIVLISGLILVMVLYLTARKEEDECFLQISSSMKGDRKYGGLGCTYLTPKHPDEPFPRTYEDGYNQWKVPYFSPGPVDERPCYHSKKNRQNEGPVKEHFNPSDYVNWSKNACSKEKYSKEPVLDYNHPSHAAYLQDANKPWEGADDVEYGVSTIPSYKYLKHLSRNVPEVTDIPAYGTPVAATRFRVQPWHNPNRNYEDVRFIHYKGHRPLRKEWERHADLFGLPEQRVPNAKVFHEPTVAPQPTSLDVWSDNTTYHHSHSNNRNDGFRVIDDRDLYAGPSSSEPQPAIGIKEQMSFQIQGENQSRPIQEEDEFISQNELDFISGGNDGLKGETNYDIYHDAYYEQYQDQSKERTLERVIGTDMRYDGYLDSSGQKSHKESFKETFCGIDNSQTMMVDSSQSVPVSKQHYDSLPQVMCDEEKVRQAYVQNREYDHHPNLSGRPIQDAEYLSNYQLYQRSIQPNCSDPINANLGISTTDLCAPWPDEQNGQSCLRKGEEAQGQIAEPIFGLNRNNPQLRRSIPEIGTAQGDTENYAATYLLQPGPGPDSPDGEVIGEFQTCRDGRYNLAGSDPSTAYYHPMLGQIRYDYRYIDAYRSPNFVTRSNVDHLYYPTPMGEPEARFNRTLLDTKSEVEHAWHSDQIHFREDMMERLMRKRNTEMPQLRHAPLRNNTHSGVTGMGKTTWSVS